MGCPAAGAAPKRNRDFWQSKVHAPLIESVRRRLRFATPSVTTFRCGFNEVFVVLVIGLRRLKAWPQRHMPPYSMAIEFTTRASPAAWRATDSAVSRCSSVATWPVRYTT